MKNHCGYIAIVGRPNVGKSTLLNAIVGKKISITSRKPQTTRHRILGIKTANNVQMIFVDTPGLHQHQKRTLNRVMNKNALAVFPQVDCILWLIDAANWTADDAMIYEKLQKNPVPFVIVLNKVDQLKSADAVIPLVATMAQKFPDAPIIPISAKKQFNLDRLEQLVADHLPERHFVCEANQITDKDGPFIAAEFIREKLIRTLSQELPYATIVSIEVFKKQKEILHVYAVIWVEKASQKGIVIGKNGETLKKIGQRARLLMEKYFEQKIFLRIWVKVKENWSEDKRYLENILS